MKCKKSFRQVVERRPAERFLYHAGRVGCYRSAFTGHRPDGAAKCCRSKVLTTANRPKRSGEIQNTDLGPTAFSELAEKMWRVYPPFVEFIFNDVRIEYSFDHGQFRRSFFEEEKSNGLHRSRMAE